MSRQDPVNPDLCYFNGIDGTTGKYRVDPMPYADVAARLRSKPRKMAAVASHAETPRSFAPPWGKDLNKLADMGWSIVFAEGTPQDVRQALQPLVDHRRKQAGELTKILDYKPGERVRDWYIRNHVSAGNFDPEIVPYYLLLVGPPLSIPFEFQYLLDVEYATGRLAFDTAAEYGHYVDSVLAYETAAKLDNRHEIAYWGTQHLGDPATNLSATRLVDPLANGVATAKGRLKAPVHETVKCQRKLAVGQAAVRDALLGLLHEQRAGSVLFTASHGMAFPSASDAANKQQMAGNGALLCQDWAGYGTIRRNDYLTADDIDESANLGGLIAFFFACYGAGTPDVDQFLDDLSQAGHAPPPAPKPFLGALPRRLLSHPKRTALAVIGHIDRAWGFSIQPLGMDEPQILSFYETLCNLLGGNPVGAAVSQFFGGKYAALSAALLSDQSPGLPETMRLSDRDLVSRWLERNDAQNYVILGDPAVRLRPEAMSP